MARITDLVKPNVNRAGAWSAELDTVDGVQIKRIYHYSTCMLVFRLDDPADEDYLDYSLGHGSVSDQGGMNQLFRTLHLPLYFSRAGGASIGRTDS